MQEIEHWLEKLGMSEYAQRFAENDIDFGVLVQLTDADLKELGVASLGHRKRLLAAITERGTAAAQAAGEPVGPQAGERRQVTILFADISGFTALSRQLDAEEVRELVARYTALVDGIVIGYGGTVDKHIGDAVMALFGAPRAHDDDPLRAARAALDIHEALARSNETARHPIEAHVGIASGEVVAGTIGRAAAHDYTVLGDSVNLAARLVGAAGLGTDRDLRRASIARCAGRGMCDALGEMALKGSERARPRLAAARHLRRCRIRERRQPSSAARPSSSSSGASLARASAGVPARSSIVRGEAGIGKTRLVEEMRRFADAAGLRDPSRPLVLDFGVGKGQDPVRALAAEPARPVAGIRCRRAAARGGGSGRRGRGRRRISACFSTTCSTCRRPANGARSTMRWTTPRATAASARSPRRSPQNACRRGPTLLDRRGSALGRSAGARASCGVGVRHCRRSWACWS